MSDRKAVLRTCLSAACLALALLGAAAGAEGPAPAISFEEIGERAGLDFVHSTRDFGERHKAEVLEMFTDGGAAAAVGDFDGDGDEDLFVVDSDEGKPHHLMRNDGDLNFTDVAAAAGVTGGNDRLSIVADALFFDYDDDGRLDLLLGRFGTPVLFRNLGPDESGQVRFQDVSKEAGLTEFGNTIAAIAFDADEDGYLDLLLGNYFKPLNLLDLETPHVLPNNLDYATNGGGVTFWKNVPLEGGGRGFVNTTEEAGFAGHTGWSLDLGHADLDNDGHQDVYIAGDYGTDRLFYGHGDGTFREVTEEALGGFDTKKGMNVDMGDYDRNGALDVYVTNITDEYMKECNMLWHNNGDGTFLDLSKETGTCDTDWGWAAKWADFDNDGWEDLLATNGLRSREEENYIPVLLEMIITPGIDFSDVNNYPDIGEMTWSGYQKNRLFHNLGTGTFKEVAGEAGIDNELDGRGLAVADFDRDGLVDVYQTNASQPALFYRNTSENAGQWVGFDLRGTESNHFAIGARVTLHADGESWIREVNGGNGYASQSTTRLHFGLGEVEKIDRVEVRWPNGKIENVTGREGASAVPLGQVIKIVEGRGVEGEGVKKEGAAE